MGVQAKIKCGIPVSGVEKIHSKVGHLLIYFLFILC